MSDVDLHRKVEAVRKGIAHIKEYCDDDDQLIADMSEGETDIDKLISTCLDMILEAETMSAALAERKLNIETRKSRLDKRAKHIRSIITLVMDEARMKTIKLDEATLTIKQLKPSIIVTDEAEIPSRFFTRAEPKLNKKELNKYMSEREAELEAIRANPDQGEAKKALERLNIDKPLFSGVTMDNGDISLNIRKL